MGVAVEKIIGLRHEALRTGLPRETAQYETDRRAIHLALFRSHSERESGKPTACASIVRALFEGEDAWQLYGVATAKEVRGRGYGSTLLAYCETVIRYRKPGVYLLWCNARVSAIGFYEKHGWAAISDMFDISTAGPHRKIIKRL